MHKQQYHIFVNHKLENVNDGNCDEKFVPRLFSPLYLGKRCAICISVTPISINRVQICRWLDPPKFLCEHVSAHGAIQNTATYCRTFVGTAQFLFLPICDKCKAHLNPKKRVTGDN